MFHLSLAISFDESCIWQYLLSTNLKILSIGAFIYFWINKVVNVLLDRKKKVRPQYEGSMLWSTQTEKNIKKIKTSQSRNMLFRKDNESKPQLGKESKPGSMLINFPLIAI